MLSGSNPTFVIFDEHAEEPTLDLSQDSTMRFIVLFLITAALAGCKDEINITVEDNSPDKFERADTLEFCTGSYSLRYDANVDLDIRLACVQAIYGGDYP